MPTATLLYHLHLACLSANLDMFVVHPGCCEKFVDDVIDRRVHMVSLLTVLIIQTFLVGQSGNFERSPPTSTVFRFNKFHWKLSVHYIENILTFSLHELLLVPEFG